MLKKFLLSILGRVCKAKIIRPVIRIQASESRGVLLLQKRKRKDIILFKLAIDVIQKYTNCVMPAKAWAAMKIRGWRNENSRALSPCLLTGLSGSTGSWPRNKSRIGPFPSGFGGKLVVKSGTTPRGDIGEEPNGVYKEGTSETAHAFLFYSRRLPLEVTEKTTAVRTLWRFIGKWIIFLLILSFSSKLVYYYM